MSKYNYIELSQAKKMTEKELNAFKNNLNQVEGAERKLLLNSFWANPLIEEREGIKLDEAQNSKGKKYLYNLGYTPKGAERKNSPYGYREQDVVKDLKEIRLIGFYDGGNFFRSFYVPLYEAISKDGTTFEYAVYGGKINILG